MKKTGTGAKGHTSKHVGSSKHHAHTSKHHPRHSVKAHGHAAGTVHTKAKHPHHARGFAIGDLLPVCAAEAVAMSLRLAGQPVADDEVAWLWELAGARELSIPEALAAAARQGIGGVRPGQLSYRPYLQLAAAERGRWLRAEQLAEEQLAGDVAQVCAHPFDIGGVFGLHGEARTVFPALGAFHALILGVDVPGPHCVLATPDGWWSWGELWTPWTRAVSEAWVVSWS